MKQNNEKTNINSVVSKITLTVWMPELTIPIRFESNRLEIYSQLKTLKISGWERYSENTELFPQHLATVFQSNDIHSTVDIKYVPMLIVCFILQFVPEYFKTAKRQKKIVLKKPD